MKKFFLFFAVWALMTPLLGQDVSKIKVIPEPFTSITAGGVSEIKLMKGDDYLIVMEIPERLQDKIKVKVNNGQLTIGYKNIKLKKNESLVFYITTPELKKINLSGAADLESVDPLETDQLTLIASGATDIDLSLDVKKLYVNASGASDVALTGKAVYEDVIVSGAADYDAEELVADTVEVVASGAASAKVNVLHTIRYKSSGAATVKFKGNPENITRNDSSVNHQPVIIKNDDGSTKVFMASENHYDYSDTVKLKVGSLDIEVVDDDTVTIRLGSHQLRVDDDGNVKWEAVKKPRFNGHWGGVEMGINGYLTNDFNTNWDKKYDYLNLRYEKSWFVNLNLWEQNIAFNKNKTIGMMTGVGLAWNNYRFSNSTYLESDSSVLKGYYMVSKAYFDPDSIYTNQDLVKKSKLTNMYISVPVLFEFQTNNPNRLKRFHFTVGGVLGIRVMTHSKVYFNMANQEYKMEDPVTGKYLPYSFRTPNDHKRNIVKEYDSFHQPPIRFDARVSVGYGWLNLFATYSVNGMFQKDKGPQLHPWSLGLTLVGW